MKKEDIKKYAVWAAPLLLIVVCLSIFFAARKGSDAPQKEPDTPQESVVRQVEEAQAASMHLRKSQGQLGVTDQDGKDCPPRDNLGLYSGYHLLTQAVSYAWIGLDDAKLAKMDENSEMGIRKEGKDLTLYLSAGGVFFNITEPLPEDETLNIRCSSMGIGIRGTCGWVQLTEDKHVMVYLLEGDVECRVTDGANQVTTVTVSAGEVGDLFVTPEGAAVAEVVPFAENYIAPFVMDELDSDAELRQLVMEVSGLDVENPPDPVERLKAEYQEIIDGRTVHDAVTDGLSYAVLYDLDQDGTEELVLSSVVCNASYHYYRYKYGDYCSGCPITQLEVYGDRQGHAAKLDEIAFQANESGYYPFEYIRLEEKESKPYIFMCSGSDVYDSVATYSFVNNSLSLVDSLSFDENMDQDYEIEAQYQYIDEVENICPRSPVYGTYEDEFLTILHDYQEMSDRPSYAKLIDMNHDGIEELLCHDDDGWDEYSDYAYWWNGSEVERELLKVGTYGYDDCSDFGLYREKSTGNIYLGWTHFEGNSSIQWIFSGLSDSAMFEHFPLRPAIIDPEDDAEALYAENDAEEQAILDEINQRFELIEKIPVNKDERIAAVDQTIQQLLDQIREKYHS